MMGKKKGYRRMNHMENYEHDMKVHRVRFFLGQHWNEDDICIALHMPLMKVRELIRESQLLDGTYELV